MESIGRSRRWFEAQLKDRGIELHAESGLQQSLNALSTLEEKARRDTTERLAAVKVQRRLLSATGADFLSKALHWGHLSGLDSFDGHWQYLKSSNPIVTGPAVEGKLAQERAFAWELALASVAATFCDYVHKAEPDLICEWEGKRIAIAAKFLFEDSQRAFVSQVKKGIAQIESADVAGGCVVINLVDLFPHADKFGWLHRIKAKHVSTLAFAAVDWVDDFLERHHPDWRRLFKGRSKLMTIAMFVPTLLTI